MKSKIRKNRVIQGAMRVGILKPFGVVIFVTVLFSGFNGSAQTADTASGGPGLTQAGEENLETIVLEKPKKEPYRREANGFNSPTLKGPWRRSIALSLWAPKELKIETITPEGKSTIRKNLNWVGHHMDYEVPFEFEVRKGSFGAYAHLLAFKLTGEAGDEEVHAKYDDEGFLLDTGISYELGTWALGSGADAPTLTIEPFGGSRWLYDPVEIRLNVGHDDEKTVDITSFSPVVGVRAFVDLTERWNVRFDGDYGGFDVDNNRETWNLRSLLGYRFGSGSVRWNVQAGYRAMRLTDLDKGDVRIRGDLWGPVMLIGAEF
jgi:hypothetical protein